MLCVFLVCNCQTHFLWCLLSQSDSFVLSYEYIRLVLCMVLVFVFVRLFAGQRHQSYSFGTTKIKNISDREINERVNFTFTQYFRVQKLYVFYLHLRGKKTFNFHVILICVAICHFQIHCVQSIPFHVKSPGMVLLRLCVRFSIICFSMSEFLIGAIIFLPLQSVFGGIVSFL